MSSTTSQASVYQQLRGHLATLKLATAAEHLPSVLDQAQTEDWSMTTTLERLLAIEVEATEDRRLTGRLRFACLPTPATLTGFDYDAAPAVDRKLVTELGTCRYLDTATNILLIGPGVIRCWPVGSAYCCRSGRCCDRFNDAGGGWLVSASSGQLAA